MFILIRIASSQGSGVTKVGVIWGCKLFVSPYFCSSKKLTTSVRMGKSRTGTLRTPKAPRSFSAARGLGSGERCKFPSGSGRGPATKNDIVDIWCIYLARPSRAIVSAYLQNIAIITHHIWKMSPHYLGKCKTFHLTAGNVAFLQMLVTLKRASCGLALDIGGFENNWPKR